MEKYIENLEKAVKNIRIADHMLYVTYPVIKDKRFLIKVFDQVYESIFCIITSILQYESLFGRIEISSESRINFDRFINKCAKKYNITPEEISNIIELFSLIENHKKSPVEFMRKERIVIVSNDLKTKTIDSEKLKKYLNLAKEMVNKTKFGMNFSN